MTANERLEAILEKAHNTITDLPELDEHAYSPESCADFAATALTQVYHFKFPETEDQIKIPTPNLINALCIYGLHLVDIIDRFDWALDNEECNNEKVQDTNCND